MSDVPPRRPPRAGSAFRDPVEGHLARVAILLGAQPAEQPAMRGLSRLSRLDFLLRFPVVLERVAEMEGLSLEGASDVRAVERRAVESDLLRWKLSVSDGRYRTLVGQLVGRQLAELVGLERPTTLRLSPLGERAVQRLDGPTWRSTHARARLISSGLPASGEALGRLIGDAVALSGP